jgi:hypothetical protein
MKKRYPDKRKNDSLLIYPVECKGYRVGNEVRFSEHHQRIVMVDKERIAWPQCEACHNEAYKIFANKNFSTLKIYKKPKVLRDINIIIRYLERELDKHINDDMSLIIGRLHIEACERQLKLMESNYGKY